jgi:ribosomal protein S18 acetylase RimI-like enzyme
MHLQLRTATADDAAALNSLVNSAFRGDSSRAGWTTEADLLGGQRIDRQRIEEIIATPGKVILLHLPDDQIDACVLLERKGEDCYLGMLTVRPTLQDRRIGRQLIHDAEQWAIEHWSTRRMYMTVLVQRPELVAWYERRGYVRTGERQPFPYGDHRLGLPQRPDLAFEVLEKRFA